MLFRLAADAILLAHLGFILFALFGALLVARRRWVLFVHLPAAAWGFFVELSGRVCPLTYWENFLRIKAGQAAYSEGFLEHYLVAIIYPEGLTRGLQFALAGIIVGINVAIYCRVFCFRR
jgi:uncharacterized protein DUF2784